jgi:LacI family transcriptional regulator
MTTLKDIAQRIGVDISTVSKVLQGAPIRVSEAKRDLILRTAREMNYRPNTMARSLRLGKSGAIAMVVPTMTNYLYPEIIAGAEEAAEAHGTILFLVKQSRERPLEQLTAVVGQGRVDGLLFADDLPEGDFLAKLRENGIPYISLNRTGDTDRYVALDDQAGFAAQAEYLAGLGHRSVAFVAVRPQSYTARLCEGYFRARWAEMRTEAPRTVLCDFAGEGCEEAADEILAMIPRPTAVAAASVIVAARLVDILRRRGVSVPEEISVVGYHDSPAATVNTVKMPSRGQGVRGVVRLFEVIEGLPFAGEVLAEPPLILDRGTAKYAEGV